MWKCGCLSPAEPALCVPSPGGLVDAKREREELQVELDVG